MRIRFLSTTTWVSQKSVSESSVPTAQNAIAGPQQFLNLRAAHAIAEAEGMIFAHGTLARRGRHNGAAQFFGDLYRCWARIQGAAAQEDDGSLCSVELFGRFCNLGF